MPNTVVRKKVWWTRAFSGKLLSGGLCGLFLLLALGAAQSFRPPRTAVVSISDVFDGYEKKNQYQEKLAGARDDLKKKIEQLEKRYELLEEEIPVTRGEALTRKKIEKYELELEVDRVKKQELNGLQARYIQYLKEIREEIADEIRLTSEAMDLDLVLERTVVAEGTPNSPGFQWPIVHYAKPEIDITQEVVGRLNRKLQSQ